MATCEICGEKLGSSQVVYINHYKRFHAIKPTIDIIRPTRKTVRSKAQIVHDMEKMLGYAIFPMVKPWQALAVR